MIYFRIFVFLLSLVTQPLLASEISGLFTVDMSKLFRSSDFGKSIISTNNKARQELQNENEKLEFKLLSEEKELSEQRKILSIDEFYKRIYPLLYELLLDRGGLVLIDQRNIILGDSSVDITDDAIKLINHVLGKDIKSN